MVHFDLAERLRLGKCIFRVNWLGIPSLRANLRFKVGMHHLLSVLKIVLGANIIGNVVSFELLDEHASFECLSLAHRLVYCLGRGSRGKDGQSELKTIPGEREQR